jgi:hypothetical protein
VFAGAIVMAQTGSKTLVAALHKLPWICVIAPMAAFAQFQASPYAGETYEYNTNIFYLPSSQPAPVGNSGPTFADSSLRSFAGIDAAYLWDQQKFYAIGEVRRFDYDHFSYLDHNEELGIGGLTWKLARILDGNAEYRYERSMVPFTQLVDTTELVLQSETIVKASANVQVTPDWQWQNVAKYRDLESPRSGAPDLTLREDSLREAMHYVGVANLSAGLDLEYLAGKFTNYPNALTPTYYQTTAQLAATYGVSGVSNFNGALGYTRRSDPGSANLSGVTGELGYRRNLTAKTSVNFELNRSVNSYVTTGGGETDTTAGLSASWNATYKIFVNVGYRWTYSKYLDSAIPPSTSDRIDHNQTATLDVDYNVLRWLAIRAYCHYAVRDSNQSLFSFSSTSYGLQFLARVFQSPATQSLQRSIDSN